MLYLARERSGLTLKEIGARAGGMEYKSVGKAVERFRRRLETDGELQEQTRRCLSKMSIVETPMPLRTTRFEFLLRAQF